MYCTTQDLLNRVGERELTHLTDFTFTGTIGQTVIDQAILDASNEIDGYLRLRYTLPLLYAPSELIAIACDIVRYRLHRDGGLEEIATRYKLAVAHLKDLSVGKAVLPSDVNTAVNNVYTAVPKVISPLPFFTESLLAKM